ncbi:MAG: hypothetical protein GXO01_01875 [Epsilonproteobacteria bacterium]|nr:hypothetical protein [Campylobacterota bacterium]
MRKDRFYRIIKEIKNGIVENGGDRSAILKLAKEYSKKEDADITYFISFEDKKAIVKDTQTFDGFIRYYLGCGFEEYVGFESKKDLAKVMKNTKAKNIHTSDSTLLHRKKGALPVVYYDSFEPKTGLKIVAIENYETFLYIDFNMFKQEDFVYLGGYPNKKTAKFLEDKEVLFFGDFDFYAMMIFESLKCKNKEFFIPENLEEYFKKYGNKELYLKQRFIEKSVVKIKEVYGLIKKYSAVLEQEVFEK